MKLITYITIISKQIINNNFVGGASVRRKSKFVLTEKCEESNIFTLQFKALNFISKNFDCIYFILFI